MSDDESDHFSNEQGWRMDEDDKIPVEEYSHTVIDLEDEVNRVMTEGCKVDACLDWFIYCLKEIDPEDNQYMYGQINFELFSGSRLEEIKEELRANLNRLVPGYLDGPSDILEVEKLTERFNVRWRSTQVSNNTKKQDDVSGAILDTLIEKHCRRHSGDLKASSTAGLPETQDSFLNSCLQLKTFIEGERTTASYTCGGCIPIVQATGPLDKHPRASGPVNIFWSIGNSSARRVSLPLRADAEDASPAVLQHLITSCDPASFGRGQEDVMDLSYRRARKLDPENFATSFHPATFGIIETIEKVLLPGIVGETVNRLRSRKIYAELYKMNIYSGPCGLFRSHVDTPRSQSQIGSLVVCLPWAAFYSDCEHEIKTVTEGDRITLTYNLYVSDGADSVLHSIMDPKSLPLYGWVKDLLMKPGFLDDGSDVVLYSIFQSLGLHVQVLPVLENNGKYIPKDPKLGLKGKVEREGEIARRSRYIGDWGDDEYEFADEIQPYLAKDEPLLVNPSNEVLPQTSGREDIADIDRRWRLLRMTRRVGSMKKAISFARSKGLPYKEDSCFLEEGVQIGSCLRPYETTELGQEMPLDEVLPHVWPAYYLPGITWLTEPKHEEMAFSQITYGNQAGLGTRYSCAAIFAVVPPWDKRNTLHQRVDAKMDD
ncbi:hypothetical protein BDV33DRAFT_190689 [Aspergillus novoparasiticus]|uniref:Prolyl 4-hydroxylase alpha subunit Fe(2+) 2OG dioxygenase domain-containing protein n=1 Tax=Aspergillus novoparasiticus TaxID=986946 RepID=A0A5N6EU35_9EURO|nr:hypothetical protein BDV33DRAFT_190689 [Aspergillus novoparasiticus]